MTTEQLLARIRPHTLAQLAAELVEDFTDEMDDLEFNFATERDKQAFDAIIAAGIANMGESEFVALLDARMG